MPLPYVDTRATYALLLCRFADVIYAAIFAADIISLYDVAIMLLSHAMPLIDARSAQILRSA